MTALPPLRRVACALISYDLNHRETIPNVDFPLIKLLLYLSAVMIVPAKRQYYILSASLNDPFFVTLLHRILSLMSYYLEVLTHGPSRFGKRESR